MHRKVKNCRSDFQHKLSKTLVTTYSLIAVEDLNVKGLASVMLAKSVNDAGWGQFLQMLKNKAVEAGSLVVEVNPRQTSQTCPNCGLIAKKPLVVRWHSCPCGCEMHRDIAAAIVILRRGLASVRNQSVDAPAARSGE
jgi:putative transposase